jgi:hypothetical protein
LPGRGPNPGLLRNVGPQPHGGRVGRRQPPASSKRRGGSGAVGSDLSTAIVASAEEVFATHRRELKNSSRRAPDSVAITPATTSIR